MIAASRFEGGILLQAGFGILFVSFGGAIAVLLVALQVDRVESRTRWTDAAAVLAWGAVAALWLPAYEGYLRGTNQLRVESGWSGFDPVSSVAIVVMATLVLVPRLSPAVVTAALASQAGLFAGNWTVQYFTERPTYIRYGLSVATLVSFAGAAVAGRGVRGQRAHGR